MLRFQIALAIILVGCIAFLSCGREQPVLDQVTDDGMPMGMTEEEPAYRSWASVMLEAPNDDRSRR